VSFALWTACVVLASFAAAGALATFGVWAAGRFVPDANADAAATARRLFALRLLPALLGAAVAGGLTLPGFLLHEPRESDEVAGLAFSLLVAAGLLSIARGIARGAADWWASRRLHRSWTRAGRPLALPGAPVPAYRIRNPFPVVSVVGILRPRLFVADQVLERLSAAELRAVLAHEAGHVAAADNLKRLLVRLCPAPPWPGAARRLEERWEQAAEEAADARCGVPLDLASALLKTARLAPVGARIELPVASFHNGSALARRVRRLTRQADGAGGSPARLRGAGRAVAVVLVAATVWVWPQALLFAHRVVEALVRLP
jgi:peptidase M48-like protein